MPCNPLRGIFLAKLTFSATTANKSLANQEKLDLVDNIQMIQGGINVFGRLK